MATNVTLGNTTNATLAYEEQLAQCVLSISLDPPEEAEFTPSFARNPHHTPPLTHTCRDASWQADRRVRII